MDDFNMEKCYTKFINDMSKNCSYTNPELYIKYLNTRRQLLKAIILTFEGDCIEITKKQIIVALHALNNEYLHGTDDLEGSNH